MGSPYIQGIKMYIKMDKIKETHNFVEYQFSITIAGEIYINEQGKRRMQSATKKGLCKFNKQTQDLIFIEHETDIYFLNQPYKKIMIYGKLMEYQKQGHFPDIIDIATG